MRISKSNIFIILTIMFLNSSISGFKTFDDLKKYVETKEENPNIDNDNWLNPDFTSYYQSQTKGILSRFLDNLLITLNIRSKPYWSIKDFYTILKRITELRENLGYTGDMIQKLTPEPNSKFIIWGDTHGALHSILRDLLEIKKFKIIDNDFNIIKINHYFIFDGNVVDRSPFILETLTLIMILMERNPGKVFYIRGHHEDKQYWQGFNTAKELQIKGENLSDENVSLDQLLTRFFDTLPLAIYLRTDPKKNNFVRISNFAIDADQRLDEKKYIDFLSSANDKNLLTHHLKNKEKVKNIPYKIEAAITCITRSTIFEDTQGLTFSLGTVPTWILLSSPIQTFKKVYNFFYDAFVILNTNKSINSWTITAYKQDVRTLTGFISNKYNLITGNEVYKEEKLDEERKKAEENPIILGSSMDFTKGASEQSKQVQIGINLALTKENREGGIKGRPVKVVFLDDEYEPGKTRMNYEKFLNEYNTNLILCPVGSPTIEGVLDLIKNDKIFVFFPISGASFLRDPKLKNIINWLHSYASETSSLIKYIYDQYKAQSYIIFYQNDSFGQAGLEGARKIFKDLNIKKVIELPYVRNQTNFKEQVKIINESVAEAIGFISTLSAFKELIRQVGIENLMDKKLFGVSDLADATEFIAEKGLSISIAEFLPNPLESNVEIIKECRDELKKNNPDAKLEVFTLLGYICTRLCINILKQIDGEITHEKIRSIIRNLNNYNFEGLKLNFNPKKLEIIDKIWIDGDSFSTDDKWIERTVEE